MTTCTARLLPLTDASQTLLKTSARFCCGLHVILLSFAVTNHGVEELEAKHFEESRKFFALPEEAKREIMMDENLRCAAGRSLV